MKLTVNGEEREVPGDLSVAALLDVLGVPRQTVAVEVNLSVVRRADHERHLLVDGDRVEVVAFVGGG